MRALTNNSMEKADVISIAAPLLVAVEVLVLVLVLLISPIRGAAMEPAR